jgi:hypothetical protein
VVGRVQSHKFKLYFSFSSNSRWVKYSLTEHSENPYSGHADIPWHRRRRAVYGVLLAIAIVAIGIGIAVAFGPIIPIHPVNPGSETSPPANTTSPSPSTTSTSQDNPTYTIAVYHVSNHHIALLDRF